MSVSTILTSTRGFARSISAFVCSLSLAAALPLGVSAATPVAVWDGNFSPAELAKFEGYTLTDWNETHGANYSSVTIDRNNQGLMFDATLPMSGLTVMVRYSGLAAHNSNNRVLFTSSVTSSHQYDRTGIQLKSDGALVGLWNNSTTANNNADNGSAAGSINASGVMAFTYSTAGTYLYYGATTAEISATSVWGSSGLKSSNDTAIYGAGIGGMYRDSSKSGAEAAKEMTITALAVFDKVLTASEMQSYIWPSEIQQIAVDADTSVSAINSLFDSSNYKIADVTVSNGVTIAVDEAFSAKIRSVLSSGSITLSAASRPDASYFSAVDFAGVEGAVKRDWLGELGIVGVNFASDIGDNHSDELVTSGTWVATTEASGMSTGLFFDGLTKVVWTSSTTYSYGSGSFISGYLDDGANDGQGATVTIDNMPYDSYDVIIYAATDSGSKFLAKTVNGKSYSAATGETAEGSGAWGVPGLATPVYNVNALRVRGLSGPLTISGGVKNGNNRGGIAAIQIMPADTPDNIQPYTLTLDGTATNWSEGAWKVGETSVAAPTSGYAVINLTASTTLTVDEAVALGDLTVNGSENAVLTVLTNGVDGSFVAYAKVTVAGGVLRQGSDSVLGATPNLYVCDGATFDLNGRAMNSATTVYLAGDGAGNWPWALTSSGGEFTGSIQYLYLTDDATVGGANKLVLGADWAGSYCYLNGHMFTKTGAGELRARNLNTPGTGTIVVSDGELHTDQWNCLDRSGGTLTLTIGANGTVRGTNQQANPPTATTLNWDGTLNTASRHFIVKGTLNGGGETAYLNFGADATANLTRDLTASTKLTLAGNTTFLKDSGATGDVTVTPATLEATSGTITVGAGVTLKLGTNRPAATFDVDDDATLAVQLQSALDVVELSASAQPASIVLYDANGEIISNPRISYADGTLTIMPPVPTLEASGDVAFDTASNWINSTMPDADGDAIIELAADATISVSGTYTLGALTISGSGEVTFAGDGSVTAANISLKNGATLVRNSKISATTGIAIDAGTVLKLDTVTENAEISGAGAVETYGGVKFTANNTFTGGLTVNNASVARTTVQQGFGKNNYGQAIANLSRIVVKDGGSLDLANTMDACYAITIAGKGVIYDGVHLGALFNSGPAIGYNNRQTASLTLSADAMVKAEASTNGWGIVNSSYAAAVLALNGHTLTVSGAGYFPMANVNSASGTTTTGTLVFDGVTLWFVGNDNQRSNLTGVDIVAKGCASINLATAPTAIGSLTIKPSNTGTSASNWNLPSEFSPTVDTSNIDASVLSAGNTVTLLTVPSAITLVADSNVTVRASGRFETAINEHTVTATLKAGMPSNFLHYDFNNDVAAAADSGTSFTVSGEGGSPAFVGAKNGRAVHVHTGYTPYWGSYANGTSPLHAGAVTVTTVAKLCETNIILWGIGSGSNGASTRTGLVVKDAHTVQVLCEVYLDPVLVELTTTEDLTEGWHFYAVVADADGVTLYVDKESASSSRVFSSKIGQQGQLGSFHGGVYGANKVGDDGYYLDDWRVYDTALTGAEIKGLKSELLPDAFFIRLR